MGTLEICFSPNMTKFVANIGANYRAIVMAIIMGIDVDDVGKIRHQSTLTKVIKLLRPTWTNVAQRGSTLIRILITIHLNAMRVVSLDRRTPINAAINSLTICPIVSNTVSSRACDSNSRITTLRVVVSRICKTQSSAYARLSSLHVEIYRTL